MNEQIIIDISKTGQVKVESNGCTGNSCSELTRDIEQALGTTVSDKKKAEFYQHHAEQNVTSSY